MYILIFILLGGVVVYCGKQLSIYGDIIGDYKGWEKSWVGILMLASITSMPELITSSVSSVLGHPEMAVSNVFGSNMFNIFVVFFLDFLILKKSSFASEISKENVITGIGSAVLTLTFILGYSLPGLAIFKFISIYSLIILVLYLYFMKILNPEESNPEVEEIEQQITYSQAKFRFILNSVIVILTGIALTKIADIIAITPIFGITLGQSFVGVILLAIATSLPELSVSINAVKLGSVDMAAGNLLGSNIFNVGIIFVAEIFYVDSSIFEKIGNFQIVSAIFSLILLFTLFLGMFKKNYLSRYNGYIIGVFYAVFMYILYVIR